MASPGIAALALYLTPLFVIAALLVALLERSPRLERGPPALARA